MSKSTTPPSDLAEQIQELVLSQLPSLRLDRQSLEADMLGGSEARIPSRKAIVIIARVCNELGARDVVKKSDLRPEQVTSLSNLIALLQKKLVPALVVQ